MNQVLSTTKYVLDRARWVHINHEKLVNFAQHFQHSAKQHWLSVGRLIQRANGDAVKFLELIHDSDEEIEIRAHTIWAVELITQEARKRIPGLMSIEVGDYLWQATQKKYPDDKPYHRTRTTAY